MPMSQYAIAAALLVSFAGAQAQATQDTLTDVNVVGTQLEESIPVDLAKYGSRLEIITAGQIEAGGYNDVAQALQMLVPGLSVVPKNGPFDYVDVSLLGGRTADTLFLIDGVRISNRLYGNTTPLDTIPAHMVERIEILKEGQGLFYGTQAVSGVVNIITRRFSDQLDVATGMATDDAAGKHADVRLANGWGSSHVVLFGSLDKSDGFQPFRDQDYQPSATDRKRSYDVRSTGLKFAQGIGERLTVSTLYQYTDAKLDFAGARRTNEDYNARLEQLANLKLDYEANKNLGIYLKAYYHDWTTHYTTTDNTVNSVTGQITGQSLVYDRAFWGYTDKGINLMARFKPHRGLEYLLGADVQQYSGADEVYTIARDSEITKAGFLQIRTTADWLPTTNVALGLRYNRTSKDQGGAIWNLSARQQLGKRLYLRGTLGTSFRLPDAYQLFGTYLNDFDTRGNPNLKPEESRNVDLGLGGAFVYHDRHFNWELTGFRRSVGNLIGSEDDSYTDIDGDGNDDFDTVAVNTAAEVTMSGGEAQWNMQAGSWTAGVNYTYAKARADGTDVQLRRIPQSFAKLQLGYAPERLRGSGGITLLHMGEVYDTINGVRSDYGDYTVVEANAGLYLDATRHHRLGFNIRNLFDTQYATRLSSNAPDVGGSSYTIWNVGEPRTFQLRYSYQTGGR
jgi:vitamin B12 transporter